MSWNVTWNETQKTTLHASTPEIRPCLLCLYKTRTCWISRAGQHSPDCRYICPVLFLGTVLLIHYLYPSPPWLLPSPTIKVKLWQRFHSHLLLRIVRPSKWPDQQIIRSIRRGRNTVGSHDVKLDMPFHRIIPFKCRWDSKFLVLGRKNESTDVFWCLCYGLFYFWQLSQKDKMVAV